MKNNHNGERKTTVGKRKAVIMTAQEKTKTKRLPKGQRAHIRRLKQEARKEGLVYKPGILIPPG